MIQPGDPISSVIHEAIVFGLVKGIDKPRGVVMWQRLDNGVGCEDSIGTEGTEWARGHITGEAAEALIAAAILTRSAA